MRWGGGWDGGTVWWCGEMECGDDEGIGGTSGKMKWWVVWCDELWDGVGRRGIR